jgi:prepilin-type N-terminal cleavage/methylation domain-containing protein/prepilin-type processing-associated H-X9-DG protein
MTKKSLRGYTLFELLIVIAMVAILATIAYPVYIGVQERGKALKDLNNLRQIGVLTQLYINDNNGVLFSPATSWMSQLYQKDGSKYVSSWDVFISPLDNLVSPRTDQVNDANSAVSYGVNPNIYPPNNNPPPNNTALSVTKITIPTAFIVFAPAQYSSNVVEFRETADTTSQPDPTSLAASPNVTVLGIGGSPPPPAPPLPALATSNPGNYNATGGTHSSRQQINALFADWHVENMLWTTFTNTTASSSDASADLRWVPYTPYP